MFRGPFSGVRSSRRHAVSATVESATNQLGDTSGSTRRQFIFCLSLYIFRLVRNRHIHFGTAVVQRYHKFGDLMHSSPYMVPPHTCPTVRLNPQILCRWVKMKQSDKAFDCRQNQWPWRSCACDLRLAAYQWSIVAIRHCATNQIWHFALNVMYLHLGNINIHSRSFLPAATSLKKFACYLI